MTYDNENIFAKILRGEIPSAKVYEDNETYAFMDIMPQSKGHCLVIPKEASTGIYDISEQALAASIKTTQKLSIACKKAFNADGITIRQHNDAAGGQEVFHTHFHIIPRYEGTSLIPPGNMGDMDEISANAELIKAAL